MKKNLLLSVFLVAVISAAGIFKYGGQGRVGADILIAALMFGIVLFLEFILVFAMLERKISYMSKLDHRAAPIMRLSLLVFLVAAVSAAGIFKYMGQGPVWDGILITMLILGTVLSLEFILVFAILERRISCLETRSHRAAPVGGKTKSCKMEMDVGKLKAELEGLDDRMPVYVGCSGECNYDFRGDSPKPNTDTFAIVYEGKLFITDECSIATDEDGNSI